LVKYDGYWQAVPATLTQFLKWAFAGRIVPHRPDVALLDGLATVWTAPRYIRAAAEYFAEIERQVERDRRFRENRERLIRDQAWQERQWRLVVHALKTGDRFRAGTLGAAWMSELRPLRKDIPAVRVIWVAAIEASGGRLPTVAAIRRARQKYELEIRRQVDHDTQGPEGG
jgi:hypothetical protein